MFIKICGITEMDDALLAAGLGAHAIGLNFASSPRHIGLDAARDIVRRLPPEILSIGVFRHQTKEEVLRIANKVGLRSVQLHSDEPADVVRWVGERVPAVIRAVGIDSPALVSTDDFGPHRLMVDAPVPGQGETYDWSLLPDRVAGRPYILAGGLKPTNVADAIHRLQPWGVDVASGVEASPGRKDPAKMRRFLVAAREAYREIGFTEADTVEYGD